MTFYSNPVTMVDPFGLCPEKAAAAFKNALEDENFQKILIGTGFIIVGGVMIAASGGTATPLVVAMGAGVVGTTATGAIIGYCENGKQGAIDGACDGYMVGGMFTPLMATGGLALEAKLTADLAAAYGGTSLAEGAQLVQKYNDRVASQGSSYSVDPVMFPDDEAAGVLRNGSYIKNPTAKNINEYISDGSNYLGSKNMNGDYMYVIDMDGNTIIGNRAGQRMPHPTLIGGNNPQVQAAGMVNIRGGKIYSINNASGHFKPSSDCLRIAEEKFSELPSVIFSKDFQGYITFE